MGDVDTEMLLWYRPEEATAVRDAYAVDAAAGASDLGGSVAAALAAAHVMFQSVNETEYARELLDKALEVRLFVFVCGGILCGVSSGCWWVDWV